MGNCAPKLRTRSPAIVAPTMLLIYGSESCPIACRIRVTLLFKPAADFVFVPDGSDPPTLWFGHHTPSDRADMLRLLDDRFGGAPAAVPELRGSAAVAAAVALQHRSVARHVDRLLDLVVRLFLVADAAGAPAAARRLGAAYGQLLEVMLEHARMEERLLFPVLDRSDGSESEVCRLAKEEHARDLPMMNGIKEDVKSLMAMNCSSSCYHEALINISIRLKKLQEHCKEHFKAEESELLLQLETAERNGAWLSQEWLETVMEAMEGTHSHLFAFFISVLIPEEAMQYIDLIWRYTSDQNRLVRILQSLLSEGKASILSEGKASISI